MYIHCFCCCCCSCCMDRYVMPHLQKHTSSSHIEWMKRMLNILHQFKEFYAKLFGPSPHFLAHSNVIENLDYANLFQTDNEIKTNKIETADCSPRLKAHGVACSNSKRFLGAHHWFLGSFFPFYINMVAYARISIRSVTIFIQKDTKKKQKLFYELSPVCLTNFGKKIIRFSGKSHWNIGRRIEPI